MICERYIFHLIYQYQVIREVDELITPPIMLKEKEEQTCENSGDFIDMMCM